MYKQKNILLGIPSTCICEISKFLKSIVDNSVIVCSEIISVIDIILHTLYQQIS